jgi:ketosteroid isomerase-like protein
VILRIPVVAVTCLALAVSACGRSEERAVRDTLESFAQATARKDYQRVCDRIFSRALVEQVRRTVPCEVALQNSSLDDARDPRLVVQRVSVDGDQASAVIRTSAANQRPSEDTVRLVKEDGEWRIQALAS